MLRIISVVVVTVLIEPVSEFEISLNVGCLQTDRQTNGRRL